MSYEELSSIKIHNVNELIDFVKVNVEHISTFFWIEFHTADNRYISKGITPQFLKCAGASC